jgi:integrase
MAIRARREIQSGRWATLRATVSLRPASVTTLGQVFTIYRKFIGPDRPAAATIELNIHALGQILREVLGQVDVPALPVSACTAELLWKWKELKRAAASAADDDERTLQILRSANSRLRQARSIFSSNEDLRTFYRQSAAVHDIAIELPDCIAAFCAEAPFGDCSKDEYHAPSDQIIARTFESLQALGKSESPDDLNMYRAVWLAIGCGLRKSEIAIARNSWFANVNGTIFCRGDVLAKNKKFPEVRVQLGAWDRLRSHIEGKDPAAYVLAGTLTERSDITFRRLSEWMRGLGWQTTHHIHEFRAWAGCQIAMAPGNDIRAAQTFLRHASFGTTEKYYGHHLKIRLQEVRLNIPTVKPAEFQPQLLPAFGS